MNQVTIVDLFISSSSDCEKERVYVEQVINEFNNAPVRPWNTTIKVISSEALYPGSNIYPQNVINNQLGNYDIYVGIWRESLGIPTPVAPSGTLEELNNALERYQKTRRPWIMCYFLKKNTVSFTSIKEKLHNSGCFYQHFNSSKHFKKIFIHNLFSYMGNEYKPCGFSSTTDLIIDKIIKPKVSITFQIITNGISQGRTFQRRSVTIGRAHSNDIVISDKRIHKEQGIFICNNNGIYYTDLNGDSVIVKKNRDDEFQIGFNQIKITHGDSIVLPSCDRIILKAFCEV